MDHQIIEINQPTQCEVRRLPQHDSPPTIANISYTNSGTTIIALINAIHVAWNEDKPAGSIIRQWRSSVLQLMMNAVPNVIPHDGVVPCFALSGDDLLLASASGGAISVFNAKSHKQLFGFSPTHARGATIPTSIIFHPKNSHVLIIGMEDSFILVYHFLENEVLALRNGHSKRVTGLAMTDSGDLLVSTGTDNQICVWSSHEWQRQNAAHLEFQPAAQIPASDTLVQFHHDQAHILIVHKLQLAQYEIKQLRRMHKWDVPYLSAYICQATYSCDGELVYAGFMDGTIRIFHAANLAVICRINPSAYLPFSSLPNVNSLVIAAHPKRAFQFAVGVAGDAFYVFEEIWDKWLGTRTRVGAARETNFQGGQQSLHI